MKPLITIIIPVYNVARYLERCMAALVPQIENNIEIILINNQSTDGSDLLANSYATKYTNVHYLESEKKGVSYARNLGLEIAKGEYVTFIDSDDFIFPKHIENFIKAIEKEKADLIICDFCTVTETDAMIEKFTEAIPAGETYLIKDEVKVFFLYNAIWNKLYKTEILRRNHLLFNPKLVMAEDLNFNLHYFLHATTIYRIQEATYAYRQRETSVMGKISEKDLQLLFSLKEIIQYYQDNNKLREYFNRIEILAIRELYIMGSVRCIRGQRKDLLQEIKKEFIKLFPNFKKNNLLSYLTKNQRIIFRLLNFHLYFLILLLFKWKKM